MRVLDNLENYNIPSGFHLTAEQEKQLAADLKEIVLALIPLRSSKLKTRQYFNSHLRYTSNVKYAQSRPDAPQDRYEFGDSYTPLPGEYTWNSNLLQPALLDILREDMYSFGFIVNYIDAGLQSRGNDHRLCYRPIKDGANKFYLTFDIDEIRAKAKSIPDLTERILFLNAKLTEYKLYDGLDRDAEEYTISIAKKTQDENKSGEEKQARFTIRQSFWSEFVEYNKAVNGLYANNMPTTDNWIGKAVKGSNGMNCNVIVNFDNCRAEIYINTGDQERNKKVFDYLFSNKAAIEEKFGGPLEWQRLDEKITCRIRIDRDLKYIEQDQRQQVIEFLTTASGKLMEVFTPYSLKYSKK